jgi:hypothetical protein
MANILKNVDKIITSAPNSKEIDLNNIQAAGGGANVIKITLSSSVSDYYFGQDITFDTVTYPMLESPQGGTAQVAKGEYAIDGGAWTQFTSGGTNASFTINETAVVDENSAPAGYSEQKTIAVRMTDDLGNTSTKEMTINFRLSVGFDATGGAETTYTDLNGEQWKVHTFTDDGDFVITGSGLVEYVIVGGGGGGGAMHYGGGGGAGGFLTNIQGAASGGGTTVPSDGSWDMLIAAGSYPVVVGAGGAGFTGYGSFGRNGFPSSFNGIVALGGGVGLSTASNSSNEPTAHNGGCGGGSASYTDGGASTNYGPGSGTSGQGNRGGYGTPNTNTWGSAGGGGAGLNQVGGDGGSGIAGNGGNGCTTTIRNTTPETFAGGGGGATGYFTNNSGGIGGNGGGGFGASYNSRVATDGADNTGGGGGGACHYNDNPTTNYCGAGGSGIVIIRYKI